MQQFSEYSGPGIDDYENVYALNSAFLKATSALKRPQRGRLARAPFLLFSLRETDMQWWESALADQVQEDLLEVREISSAHLRRIQIAALSFLSQLCRRNAYAARIVSGATIPWCERISELPLITLMDRVATRDDLLLSRLHASDAAGKSLLAAGTSSKRQVRKFSHMRALQSLLATSRRDNAQLPAAACVMTTLSRSLDKKV